MAAETKRYHMWLVVLAASCSFVSRVCAFAGGTGEPNDPYQIATAAQLISIGSDPNLLDKHFVLLNDVDLDPNLPGGRLFDEAVIAPSTPNGLGLTGSFDGRGHAIRNPVVRAKPSHGVGVFGGIDKCGVVKNLKIEAAHIQADAQGGDPSVGILAGINEGGVINCRVGGCISRNATSLDSSNVGGLVGYNRGVIMSCQTDTNSVRGYGNVGGLVGTSYPPGRIVGCRATSKQVWGHRSFIGGLVGANNGYIVGSCAASETLGSDLSSNCGGLVGTSRGTIMNCHATSNISSGPNCQSLGGLAGGAGGTIINCYATGSISAGEKSYRIGGLVGSNSASVRNSYAAGKISVGAGSTFVGGLVGLDPYGNVKTCFWDIEASGMVVSDGGTGLTTAQMQEASTFLEAGWDFVDERVNGTTDAWRMPEGGGYPALTLRFDGYNPHPLAGEGTAEAPYLIGTAEDLSAMWRHDPSARYRLTSNVDLSGLQWVGPPILAFNGTFDGAGFLISHLTLREATSAGLFGILTSDAIIMNLGIADANIVGGDNLIWGMGGLAAGNFGGHVVACYATGRLSAEQLRLPMGGLIGQNYGFITDCYATTDVSCARGDVGLGGLVGWNYGSIERSYASGSVAPPDPNGACGGLLGWSWDGTITNCYFLEPADGGGPDNGSAISLTNSQMKRQASFANWDFVNTWTICEGRDYPRLRWEKVKCSD